MATTLVVGSVIKADDTSGKYSTKGDVWTDYMVRNKYHKSKRTYQMGIASPNGFLGASVAFVKLASDTLIWICDWTACKYNAPPESPDPTSQDPNWILLDECPEAVMLRVADDGATPLYRLKGRYIYGHKNPNVKTNLNMAFPRPPWLMDTFSRTVPSTIYQKTINLPTTNAVPTR